MIADRGASERDHSECKGEQSCYTTGAETVAGAREPGAPDAAATTATAGRIVVRPTRR
jgi:hypothetical protein